jgi:hypothetical protein
MRAKPVVFGPGKMAASDRFSPGIAEAPTWSQDNEGWTTCNFNRRPDLRVAAHALGGAEMSGNAGFAFDTAQVALQVAEALGETIKLPEKLLGRETHLKKNKDGRLVMWLKQNANEEKPGVGWSAKKGWWEKVFNVRTEQKNDDLGFAEYDNIVRQLVTPVNEDAGWVIRGNSGWQRFSTDKVKLYLNRVAASKPDIDYILGGAIHKAWRLVNVPFMPEYPGDRQWNMDSAQYRFKPAEVENPLHPHWDRILSHCGQDLDAAIRELEWAKRSNIKCGADYLLNWVACLLREPFEPLPYLFLFGDQNSGKSILHEAIALLVTKGVASADRALSSSNDFNGELANCFLAYIEEKNLSKEPQSTYNKIKDWVTSPRLWIRKMRTDSYSQANTLHFIQCSNELESCPILPGDTRITVIHVPNLQPGDEIPKRILMSRLEEEAPHFMRTLLDLSLPQVEGRLRLPVIRTKSKFRAEELNRSPLEEFIRDRCHNIPGASIPLSGGFGKRHQRQLQSPAGVGQSVVERSG